MAKKTNTKMTLWDSPGLATHARASSQPLAQNKSQQALEVKGEPVFPRGLGTFGFGGRFQVSYAGSNIDYASDVGPLWHSSLVMAIVNFVGTLLTEAPPQVVEFQKKDNSQAVAEAVPDHPVTLLLNAPNPYTTGDAMMMAFALDWFIHGNVYWMKERDPNNYNTVVRLWPLPAFMVRPDWDRNDPTSCITRFLYRCNGRDYPYLPEDIIHFKRGMDPQNFRLGLAAFQSVLREIYGDNMAANFSAVVLKNWGVLPFVISPKKGVIVGDENSDPFAGLTEPQAAEKARGIKQSFIDATTGDKRGQPLVQTIPLDITKLGFNPAELDISKLGEVKESRVAAVSGIPAQVLGYLVGLVNGTNRATYEQAVQQAYYMVIKPMMKIIATSINNNLLTEFGSAKGTKAPKQEFGFDFSKVQALQEDRDKVYSRGIRALAAGGITLNMFRASVDKPLEDVDVIFMPRTSLPVTLEAFAMIAADPTALQGAMPQEVALARGGTGALPPEAPPPKQIGTGKAAHNGNGHNGFHLKRPAPRQIEAVKSVEYDGMSLWREPTPLERTINLKAIQDAFDSGEKQIEQQLLDLREKLIAAAIAGIIILSPSDYHTLTLTAPAGAVDDLRKELQAIYDRGRQLVLKELEAQGATGLGSIGVADEVDAAALDMLAGLSASRLMNDLQSRVIGAAAGLAVQNLTASELETALQDAIDSGSTGYVTTAALAADHVALGLGRIGEMNDQDGIREFTESCVLDKSSCDPCISDDGITSTDITDLPGEPNPHCEAPGGLCRCIIIAVWDEEAKGEHSSRKRQRRTLPAQSGPLTTPERGAMVSYQSDGYRINKALRDGIEVPESDLIDSALEKSAIADTVTVYHGLGEVLPRNLDLLKTVGAEISDAGYLSCSLKLNHARLFSTSGMETVLAITLPKGAPGYQSDDEVILPRDFALRIVGSLKDGETNIINVFASSEALSKESQAM